MFFRLLLVDDQGTRGSGAPKPRLKGGKNISYYWMERQWDLGTLWLDRLLFIHGGMEATLHENPEANDPSSPLSRDCLPVLGTLVTPEAIVPEHRLKWVLVSLWGTAMFWKK